MDLAGPLVVKVPARRAHGHTDGPVTMDLPSRHDPARPRAHGWTGQDGGDHRRWHGAPTGTRMDRSRGVSPPLHAWRAHGHTDGPQAAITQGVPIQARPRAHGGAHGNRLQTSEPDTDSRARLDPVSREGPYRRRRQRIRRARRGWCYANTGLWSRLPHARARHAHHARRSKAGSRCRPPGRSGTARRSCWSISARAASRSIT